MALAAATYAVEIQDAGGFAEEAYQNLADLLLVVRGDDMTGRTVRLQLHRVTGIGSRRRRTETETRMLTVNPQRGGGHPPTHSWCERWCARLPSAAWTP